MHVQHSNKKIYASSLSPLSDLLYSWIVTDVAPLVGAEVRSHDHVSILQCLGSICAE
jgi:hypothetical protein